MDVKKKKSCCRQTYEQTLMLKKKKREMRERKMFRRSWLVCMGESRRGREWAVMGNEGGPVV